MTDDVDLPPEWDSFADELQSVLRRHPEFDLEDAIEALIWGMEEEDENE